MAHDLSAILRDAHELARRARDVHPLLRSKLPPYRVSLAKALRESWAAHKRYAPVIAMMATRSPSPEYEAAQREAFILKTKERLTPADYAELARLNAVPVYAV